MLDFLVTSKVRRRLLHLLVVERSVGSVAQLAKRARVSRASVLRELRAMQLAGLVSAKRKGDSDCFEATDCAATRALTDLARADQSENRDDQRTRNELFTLGAPTFGEEVPVDEPERVLVAAVALAHRDGTVASVLPVCFYKLRDRLSPERLTLRARELGEKQSTGFFLELTSDLSHDPRFAEWAAPLRDKRCRADKFFFASDTKSALSKRLAREKSPPAARRWGFYACATTGSFESMFKKHAHA